MSIIGELIYTYRKEYGITQDTLVEELSGISPDLQKLNTVTLSRWETGTTSPGDSKKKTLLKFIVSRDHAKNTRVHTMLQKRFRLLAEATSSVLPGANKHLVGNLPLFDNTHDCIDLFCMSHGEKAYLEHILDIEKAAHAPGYCRLSMPQMEKYLQFSSTFAVVCNHKKHYLGHFIMLKIKPDTAVDIAHSRKSKYDILPEDLCSTEEEGSYIIQAVYASNPKYAMLMKTKAYLFLLDNVATVKDFVIFSTRTDGEIMSRNYGIKQVAEGTDEQYGFKWFGMLSPVEDVLFSDTVVKLIF